MTEGRIRKGRRKLWGMMAMFIILIDSDDFKGVQMYQKSYTLQLITHQLCHNIATYNNECIIFQLANSVCRKKQHRCSTLQLFKMFPVVGL